MNKLLGTLLAATLLLGACTTPEEPPSDDIAALEGEGDAGAKGAKGGTDSKKGDPKKGGGSGGGGGNGGGTGSGGNGRGTQTGGDSGGGSGSGGSGGPPSSQPQAAAAAPIPAGRYEYATDGERSVSGNRESLPETTTMTAGAPSGGKQRQTRDLRDSEGNGIVTDTDLVYGPKGVSLSYVKITSRFQGGLTDVREFRLPRPEMIAPRGAGPGTAGTFVMEGSGTRAKVTVRADRYENVSAGGQQLRALVVQTDIVFTGALEGHQRSISWFWPKHLLVLKEQVDTDVTNGPIRLQSNYEATIKRIP